MNTSASIWWYFQITWKVRNKQIVPCASNPGPWAKAPSYVCKNENKYEWTDHLLNTPYQGNTNNVVSGRRHNSILCENDPIYFRMIMMVFLLYGPTTYMSIRQFVRYVNSTSSCFQHTIPTLWHLVLDTTDHVSSRYTHQAVLYKAGSSVNVHARPVIQDVTDAAGAVHKPHVMLTAFWCGAETEGKHTQISHYKNYVTECKPSQLYQSLY